MDESITGRDDYIIAKALAYAIEAIEALPFAWQEVSDQADMKRMLERMVGNDAHLAMLQKDARNHLTRGA